jgi:DoxX-like family
MIATTNATAPISRTRLWTGRVIAAWLVLFLAFDAIVKVLNLRVAVEGTTRLGYPAHLVVILGLVQLVCLMAFVVPRTSLVGAILLTGYLGGATATQVRVESPWFLLPAALGGLVWVALCLHDPRVGTLLLERSRPSGGGAPSRA